MYQKIKSLLLLIVITNVSIAQTGDTFDSATLYLTGAFKNYNPQRAFQINLQNAQQGKVKAMNAVAMQYTKGLGTDSNTVLATYWFNQAANYGYTKAIVNLGMLYKHNATDSNGYAMACNYFNQALLVNEPSAYFAMGYMYYKGLGCTQSYTNALQLFNQGITFNQPNCFYFKGLCYKYGYGLIANTDSANWYIDSAAKLGYKQAYEERNNNNQTTTNLARTRTTKQNQINNSSTNEQVVTTNTTYQNVAKTNQAISLNGLYKGNVSQYDYSGKKLLAQIPITLNLITNNQVVNGELMFNNETIKVQAIQQGNQLIFSETSINIKDKKGTRNNQLIFKNLTLHKSLHLEGEEAYLTGTLQLFNTYTRETYPTINIILYQKVINEHQLTANAKDQNQTLKHLTIYPNPTKGTFTVSFNLIKESPVKLSIYNQQGSIIYTKVFELLPAGKQNILCANLNTAKGIYRASIKTNLSTQTTAFIYEK